MKNKERPLIFKNLLVPLTTVKAVTFIVIIGITVYLNGLFATFAWDDYDQLLNNAPIHSITNFLLFFQGGNVYVGSAKLFGIYYKPAMSTVFSLIYTIFGPNPFFFHLTQIVIHILNTILIFFLFKKFFSKIISFSASLIFLIHPINTEAVIFVSALQDPLFMFFGLLSLLVTANIKTGTKSVFAITILLFLSLLSKETGILFFLIIPVFKIIYDKRGLLKIILAETSVFVIYLFLRFFVAGIGLTTHGYAPIMQTLPTERLLTIVKIFSYYFQTFLFPKDLAIGQTWIIKKITFFDFYLPLLFDFFVVFSAICLYIWLKRKREQLELFYFFVFWLCIGLLFHLQIFALDMTVAERWFYFPMVGLLGLFCVIIQNIKVERHFKVILYMLLTLIVITLSIRTIVRNNDWSNELKLYQHDAIISKDSVSLIENIGTQYYKRHDLDKVQYYFQEAIKLEPRLSIDWYNLAVIAGRKNNFDLARTYYQKSIELGAYQPSFDNLAVISFAHAAPIKTEKIAQQALQKFPSDPKLWLILTLTEYKLSKQTQALQAAKNTYLLSPNSYTESIYNAISNHLKVQDPKINFE